MALDPIKIDTTRFREVRQKLGTDDTKKNRREDS